MIRLALLCAVLAIPGCSTSGGGVGNALNRYEYAAYSWTGASIQEMVAAWGTPNSGYKPPDSGKDGVAGWDVRSSSGGDYRYRCTTLAYFDSDGLIIRIFVKHSRSCHRRYEGEFGRMTRQEPTSNGAPIET